MIETRPKTLYMLWPPGLLAAPFSLEAPQGFKLRLFQEKDRAKYFHLVSYEEKWLKSEKELDAFLEIILPEGLFLVEDFSTGEIVATAGAIHNPQGGSHYFPGGGELAFVLVKPAYRRRGLGNLVCMSAINCFLREGYTSIRLGVKPENTSAIALYLGLGFQPFIYSPEMELRWETLLAAMGWPVELERPQWIHDLK